MEGKLDGFERGFHRLTLWPVVKIQFQTIQTLCKCKIPQAWKCQMLLLAAIPCPQGLGTVDFFFPMQVFKSAVKPQSPGQKKLPCWCS